MTRSFRKPIGVDGYGSKWKPKAKREANKRVRRTKEVADGKSFRKVYNPLNICDFKLPMEPTKKNRTK